MIVWEVNVIDMKREGPGFADVTEKYSKFRTGSVPGWQQPAS